MLFSFPLMSVIQSVSAGLLHDVYGTARNLRRRYSPWLLRAVMAACELAFRRTEWDFLPM
jgi:hypothetical protein